MVNRRPQLRIVAPSASPEEAVAVVAALEQFLRDTARPAPAPPEQAAPPTPAPRSAWARAALLEGAGYAPGEDVAWVRAAG